jgi:hypothetical protein
MTCIADVAIAMKVAELAKRCGLKASEVDGAIGYIDETKDPEGNGFHIIHFVSDAPQTAEKAEQKDRFFRLLGLEDSDILKGPELEDLEDKVDRALSLAPRSRTL